MKALVPLKRVIDYNVRVRVNKDHTGVEKDNVKMSMNPFDEIALEAALQLKEQGVVSDICVISIGDQKAQETLRHGLAMGADRAILVEANDDTETLHVAKILAKIAEQEAVQLVLLGKQAIDNDCNVVGQMLAGMLGWSQATFASNIKPESDGFVVTREVDGGLQTIKVNLPAIITADLRLNTPRFVSLPNIMKAKAKPIQKSELASLELELSSHIESLSVEPPPEKTAGVKVANFAELMEKLKEEQVL